MDATRRPPLQDSASALLPAGYGGLRALQAEFRRYQDAAFPTRPSRFFALELAGETGELANLEKKVWKGRTIDQADFEDEAADVCIALLNYANSRGVDLAHAVNRKMGRIDARRLVEPECAEAPPAEAPSAGAPSAGAPSGGAPSGGEPTAP